MELKLKLMKLKPGLDFRGPIFLHSSFMSDSLSRGGIWNLDCTSITLTISPVCCDVFVAKYNFPISMHYSMCYFCCPGMQSCTFHLLLDNDNYIQNRDCQVCFVMLQNTLSFECFHQILENTCSLTLTDIYQIYFLFGNLTMFPEFLTVVILISAYSIGY